MCNVSVLFLEFSSNLPVLSKWTQDFLENVPINEKNVTLLQINNKQTNKKAANTEFERVC